MNDNMASSEYTLASGGAPRFAQRQTPFADSGAVDFRLLVEMTEDMLSVVAEDGTFLYVSSAVERILGYRPEELVGTSVFGIFHDDEQTSARASFAAIMRGEPQVRQARQTLHKRGGVVWCESLSRRMSLAAESPPRLVMVTRDVSQRESVARERHRLLAELQAKSHTLEGILASVQELIFGFDAQARLIYVNHAARDSLDISFDDPAEKAWAKLGIPESTVAPFYRDLAQVLATSESCRGGIHFPAFGENRVFEYIINPVLGIDGAVQGAVCVSRDVTERHASERALIESERALRTLFEALPAGVWLTDAQGVIIFCNPEARAIWGGARFVGIDDYGQYKGWWAATGEPVAPREWPLARALLRGEKCAGEMVEIETFDRARKTISISALPLRDDRGAIIGAVSVNEDVTDERLAAEQLRSATQRLSLHVENTPLAFVEWNANLRVLRWSKRAEEMFGWTFEEVRDMNWKDWRFVYPDDLERVERMTERLFDGIDPYNICRNRNFTRDGRMLYCEWYNSVLFDDDGRMVSLLSLVQDLTERTLGQKSLHQRELELAHVSRLSNMGELVAGIAHEINQPLQAISNFANACVKQLEADPEAVEKVEQWSRSIVENTNRAGEIIRRLRDFVRKMPLRRQTCSLDEILRESLELVTVEQNLHGVETQLLLGSRDALVVADSIQLQQVMVNLLRNAYAAVSVNAPGNRVVLVRKHVAGDTVTVSVEDNGPGVLLAEPDQLFDAFYTTKAEGMGMGLAISRTIINSHLGKIWVDPVRPHGAAFRFSLPCGAKEEEEQDELKMTN